MKKLKGKIHSEISLSEYFIKYSFNVDLIVYLNIKFQLNGFSKLSLNISVKDTFGFQKLNISFSEILFQKKPDYMSSILLFQLRNREEVLM